MLNFIHLIDSVKEECTSIFNFPISKRNALILDFSKNNKSLTNAIIDNPQEQESYIKSLLKKSNKKIGLGGYLEERILYKNQTLFDENLNARCVHLGIDFWMDARTPVYNFYSATVHSFQNNRGSGNYGPTIILKHKIKNLNFFSLYGHLSLESIKNLKIGSTIKTGEKFAYIGNSSINGNYAPHLHFQLILDMQNKKGDFIGVCKKSEIDTYKSICPDPNIILGFDVLKS